MNETTIKSASKRLSPIISEPNGGEPFRLVLPGNSAVSDEWATTEVLLSDVMTNSTCQSSTGSFHQASTIVMVAYLTLLSKYSLEDEISIACLSGDKDVSEAATNCTVRGICADVSSFGGLAESCSALVSFLSSSEKPPSESGDVVEALQRKVADCPIAFLGDGSKSQASKLRCVGGLDMCLSVRRDDHNLCLVLGFNRSVLSLKQADEFLAHLATLLTKIIATPDVPVWQHDLLTQGQRDQIVEGWNQTECQFDTDSTIVAAISQVAVNATGPAVVFGDQELTYFELLERSAAFAERLRRAGVCPGDIVPVRLDRSLELIVSLIGIMSCGAAYLPVEPDTPPGRLEFIILDCQAKVVVGLSGCEGIPDNLPVLFPEMLATKSVGSLTIAGSPDSLAYVIYTSGSTGQPKGVMVEHRSLLNRLRWMEKKFAIGRKDRILQKTPIGFDVSVSELFLPLICGATLVFAEPGEHLDPVRINEVIESKDITWVHFVPSMLNIFLKIFSGSERISVRRVFCSGEALAPETVQRFHKHIDGDLYNLYGPTEATIDVTASECSEGDAQVVTIGRPIANTRAYILDRFGRPVPVGIPGELIIAGVQVARGYLNRPELTDERFVDDPFVSGARAYLTGDIARWTTDGQIEFLGRSDGQIKIGGVRIEVGEVEMALLRETRISDVAVVAATSTQGHKFLVAYYVSDRVLDEAHLKRQLSNSLSAIMIPDHFIRLDCLPITRNGKLDRSSLPSLADRQQNLTWSTGASNTLEASLLECWQSVLGSVVADIDTNFFDIGGTSLQAIEITTKVFRSLSLHISPFMIQRHPTIRKLVEADLIIDVSAVDSPQNCGATPAKAPLTPQQELIWRHQSLYPHAQLYNEQFVVGIYEELDVPTLETAISSVLNGQDIYNVCIVSDEEKPFQVLRPRDPFRCNVIDVSNASDPATAFVAHASDMVAVPFDLANDRLIRIVIYKLGDLDFRVVIIAHHLIVDGVSVYHLLLPELESSYRALIRSSATKLQTGGHKYLAYADQIYENRCAPLDNDKIAFWKSHLEGRAATRLLSRKANVPAVQADPNGSQLPFVIGRETTARIRNSAKEVGVSTFSFLLSCFGLVLKQFSQEDEVVLGTITSGRNDPETLRMHGVFMNTLPLHLTYDDEVSVRTQLQRDHSDLLDALEHEIKYDRLMSLLQRDFVKLPPLNIMFVLEPKVEIRDAAWLADQTQLHPCAVKHDLTIELDEKEYEFIGRVEYRNELFDEAFVRALLQSFLQIVESLSDDLDCKLDEVGRDERQTALTSETIDDGLDNVPIVTLFENQAKRVPDSVAVMAQGVSVSYDDLNRRANRLAHCLLKRGTMKGSRVGICLEPGISLLVSILGVLKTGAAYVPIDPSYPGGRIENLVEGAALKLVVAELETAESFSQCAATCVLLDEPEFVSELGSASDVEPEVSRENLIDAPAYVIFTSGSTGRPKGVVIPHRSLSNYVRWGVQFLELDRVFGGVVATSFGFDATVTSLFCPLASGRAVCLATVNNNVPDLEEFLFDENQDYLFKLTPAHLALISARFTRPKSSYNRHAFVIGGEQLTISCLEGVRRLFPNARFINEYGPTETTVGCVVFEVGESCDVESQTVPIGRPTAGTKLLVADKHGRAVSPGAPGELLIGGPCVGLGYLNMPELTDNQFVSYVVNAERPTIFYKSGDIVRQRSDGNLEFLYRRDDQIKIRGFRIEIGEIEQTLRQCAEVSDAIVLPQGMQNVDTTLCAYLEAPASIDPDLVIKSAHLQSSRHLPSYMRPTRYAVLDRFPLTSHAKVDRSALMTVQTRFFENAGLAPSSDMEIGIAAIWSELLNVDVSSIDDNFFDLGGNSILAIKAAHRIGHENSVDCSLGLIYDAPTIAELTSALGRVAAGRRETRVVNILQSPPHAGPGPLTLGLAGPVRSLWMVEEHKPSPPHAYTVPLAVKIYGSLELDHLQRAANQLLQRHDVLRSRFHWGETGPRMVVDAAAEIAVQSYRTDRATWREAIRDASRVPFDLNRAPLVRFHLFDVADEEFDVLLITQHHIITDGWSLKVLARELSCLYRKAAGTDVVVERPSGQFRDYLDWQTDPIRKSNDEKATEYWVNALKDATRTQLPVDIRRCSDRGLHGQRIDIQLDPILHKAIDTAVARLGTTHYPFLLGLFTILLHNYCGQRDIVIGTPVANRERLEFENVLGYFVNLAAIRQTVEPSATMKEHCHELRRTLVSALKHQSLPFEAVVDAVSTDRSYGSHPLFDIVFAFEDASVLPTFDLPNTSYELVTIDYDISRFDLTVYVRRNAAETSIGLEFNKALFDQNSAERMIELYCDLIANATDQIEVTIGSLLAGMRQSGRPRTLRKNRLDIASIGRCIDK